MNCISTRVSYGQANHFTKTTLDYLGHADALSPFYAQPPSIQGIRQAIEKRKDVPVNRKLLVEQLTNQYSLVPGHDAVKKNIGLLESENTFTITTAHQPNLFTGPLYFIYKILHAVTLADHCRTSLPGYNFVPVFYMGSEDADLDELGHFYMSGEKLSWDTKQSGAVGRMIVDKELLKLIDRLQGQLSVLPFGNNITTLLRDSYREGRLIQDATFHFLNSLFGEYGLVVLVPDTAGLKKEGARIFADDLLYETPSAIVENTAAKMQAAGYKVQANPREINLFYLKDNLRDRIVKINGRFVTNGSRIEFDEKGILLELEKYPERFSPNVILRGLYQEVILPNLVYIGGGGELSYWLQLKDLFEHYKVPYPVLLLRNSFLVIEKKWLQKIDKLGFSPGDMMLAEGELVNRLVARDSRNQIKLNGNFTEAENLYETLKKQVAIIDSTLAQHVDALKNQSLYRLRELEKKMLRAEKRKFSDGQRQIHAIKEKLFPKNNLQERIDNFMYYYALWGKDFLQQIRRHSLSLEEEFVVIIET